MVLISDHSIRSFLSWIFCSPSVSLERRFV